MSEEEKKAIEYLKSYTNFYDYELKNGKYIYELFKIEVYKKDVDIVLNLIDRLQKELENSISKDKIKEQIEDLDLIDKYTAPKGWTSSERKYAREILKDLLLERK